MVETTCTNLLFEEQNGNTLSKIARSLEMEECPKGHIELKCEDFPSPGMYQIRLFAKDKNSERIGQASDHVVVSVDN